MKQNGPGRNTTNANPNFVLTEMIVKVEGASKPLDFVRVVADFNQGGFLPGNCLMEIWIPVMDGQSLLNLEKLTGYRRNFEPLVLDKIPYYRSK